MSGPAENQARRDALSAARRALLDQRLRGERGEESSSTRARTAETTVLSPGQERLWFLQQLAPENPAYNMPQAFRVRGPLDVGALQRSLERVVQRHEVLRTSFPAQDGRPRAAHCVRPFELVHVDLSVVAAAQREEAATAHSNALARLPFDLATGPLMRAALLRLGRDEHVLVIVLHHIVCDEWSLDLFWRDMAAFYDAADGLNTSVPPLSMQYAEYAAEQRALLDGGRVDRNLEYWRSRLAGPTAKLQLPYDRPDAWNRKRAGALARATMPATVAAALAGFARAHSATPFVVLLAAFKVLLHRYTAEVDVMVGSPFTGRTRHELESVVGFFINTVVLRTDLSGDPPFTEAVQRVRTSVLEALAHQELPFEQVVNALRPGREVHQNPLFQVMFVLQRRPHPPHFSSALHTEPFAVENGGAKLDLTLFVDEPGEGPWQVMLEYDADRFERATAERMLLHFGVLLEAALRAPDTPLSRLPLLPDTEVDALRQWESGAAVSPPARTVHEWIAQQAELSPAAVAVISEEAELTYGELFNRVRSLARRLRASGAGSNVCVGLCADRSADMIVGILAILEAGAAYVPIDPAYPDSRIRFTIEDAAAPILLVQRRFAARFGRAAQDLLVIDEPEGSDTRAITSDVHPGVHVETPPVSSSDDVAYVIYTSGSTGQPKGVRITHHNLLYSTAARLICYAESPARFLLLSSFAFDSAVGGIFWTLCTGGTLVLPPARAEQDIRDLAQRIARHGVTHTLLLPSLYTLLLEHAPPATLASLRTVIVAGEACATSVAQAHHTKLPLTALYNEYGPTEATVWSTVHRVGPEDCARRVPIGRPVPGSQVHVLDAQLQRAPIGVAAELLIGGAGIAAGYLNRPAETSSRFIADPFSEKTGARLYRTGDRARWTTRGELEFLGRADDQVKIRGHRIEPAEIKVVLDAHPGVLESAVTVRGRSERNVMEALIAALEALPATEADALLREVEQMTEVDP